MLQKAKELILHEEDTWSFGLPQGDRTKFICDLFYLLEENLVERNVLSLPWAPLTEVMIDSLHICADNSITVRLGVTAEFSDINSFCKSCENSRDLEADILKQVKTLIQSIRDCDL